MQTIDNTITLPDGRVFTAAQYEQKLTELRAPFPADQIEKLPKQVKSFKQDPQQGKWQCRQGTNASADRIYCGGYHARSVHLDYIGHATITERLNAVDPFWTINFLVTHPDTGVPFLDPSGTWFTMTVLGATRICVGDFGRNGVNHPDGRKELIGDAIRNGAMRFGVGTYLWSKSEEAARRKIGEAEAQPDPEPQYADPVGSGKAPAQEGEVTTYTEDQWRDMFNNSASQGPYVFVDFVRWAYSNGAPEIILNALEPQMNSLNNEAQQRGMEPAHVDFDSLRAATRRTR